MVIMHPPPPPPPLSYSLVIADYLARARVVHTEAVWYAMISLCVWGAGLQTACSGPLSLPATYGEVHAVLR